MTTLFLAWFRQYIISGTESLKQIEIKMDRASSTVVLL